MLTLVLIAIIIILYTTRTKRKDEKGLDDAVTCILLILLSFGILIEVLFIFNYSYCTQTPIKISMYQEENNKIEKDINELVSNYMKHEEDTFSELKVENNIALVSMYPELKSDKLVKEQMKTYISNNNKIKELKEKEIDVKVINWWLYFNIGDE